MSEIYALDKSYAERLNTVLAMRAEGRMPDAKLRNADFQRSDNVGVIRVQGVMMKGYGYPGYATDTIELKNKLRAAARDESIKGIMIVMDTPGGEVGGLSSVVDTIKTVKKTKPVAVAIDDLGASAGYEVASHADSISINRTGMVGSIGVFTVLYDDSQAFEDAGVKAYLVSSGDLKGWGAGVPISDDELAETQKQIDFYADVFKQEVSTGRGIPMDKVATVATGAVFTPKEAKKLGLIDTIADVETALSNFKATLSSPDRGARVRRKLALTKHRRK